MHDSTQETQDHIALVNEGIGEFIYELERQAHRHDASKLQEPEKSMFDKYTPMLRSLTYGSEEYHRILEEMKNTALAQHYQHNSHHPEHYAEGVAGMTLMDVVEMFCDWRAAVQRHDDGSLLESIKHNKERFGISDQLTQIFLNTAIELGWLESEGE